jgi:tRNA1(Val) A37 N6-methylase TrmN6
VTRTTGQMPPTEGESDDAFLGGRLQVLQPRTGYRAGIDGVLLAATVDARPGAQVLDVGAGVGIVGLCIACRLPDVRVTMVERDAGLATLARRNIGRNGFSNRARLIEADVLQPLGSCSDLSGIAESFDYVIANPPFFVEGHGTAAGDPVKARANAMPPGALERWVRFMAAMARPGGRLALIHRAEALAEVLDALAGRFGEAIILPLHARAGEPATRLLVHAVKGSRGPLQLQRGLILHGSGNGFRSEVAAALRDAASLPLSAARSDASENTRGDVP